MSITDPTLLQLKIKLKKEKDINIMNKIQIMIDQKIDDSRDRWWFRKKFFEELAYESTDESENLNDELNKPRSIDRFLLDSEIIDNYSKHIDKPYAMNDNTNKQTKQNNKQTKQNNKQRKQSIQNNQINNLGKRKDII
jgi:hypothetical protein